MIAWVRSIQLDGSVAGCLVKRVRNWIKWLLVLGVFAGLSGRLLADFSVHEAVCDEVVECCDGHDAPEAPVDEEEEHGPDCPPGPHGHHQHHHGSCCAGVAMTSEGDSICRLAAPREMRAGLAFGLEMAPEEPVFLMDKPPLI